MFLRTEPEKGVVATTQSLEGKVYKCCTNDCKQSFSSMHHLMNHMKVHHKPNRYFKCEACKLRFRTHRSLLKHMHICFNTATNALPQKVEKQCPSPLPVGESDALIKQPVQVEPVKFQSVIKQLEKDSSVANMDTISKASNSRSLTPLPNPLPTLHTPLSSMPLVSATPHSFSLLEPSLFATPSLSRFPSQAHNPVPGPFIPFVHPAPYSLSQSPTQTRLRSYIPSESLPFSSAVWRKSAAQSANSRIVWEHTRGRYSCMQCPFSSLSREEMTLHLQEHNKILSSRLPNEMGVFVNAGNNYGALPMQFSESLFT
ncbi:zinc finger protein 414 [Rhincodon typus]|uniref:zinc finger protein 414 n=1 Tax=Rhincodon typus TaxID=259920 RepID=UPI0009A2BD80|nr:zinc finger protein 414 [Rhincodon typus]XP_048469948.1 zinc finger protein 414 [Rhincodon typus]XP_048469949.1 zinc finger protein 414 [Rhincodon typus]